MDCPLDVMDLPIQGECNHIIGDCYCYMCNCGKHQCPSNTNYKRTSPTGIYRSIYKSAFSHHPATPALTYIREGELLHSKQKMLLQTTQKVEYEKFTPEPIESYNCQTKPGILYKFVTSSTYQSDFPNWESYKRPHKKDPAKYSVSPIKFSAVSTYGQDFQKHEVKSEEKKTSKSPYIINNSYFFGKTTNREMHRPYKVQAQIRKRYISEEKNTYPDIYLLNTTYRQNFLPTKPMSKIPTKKQMTKLNDSPN